MNAEPYKAFNMWNAQKCSHDVVISAMAPSYCRKCGMDAGEISRRFCPMADPARLAATLDDLLTHNN